ncbi:MAG: cytochrome c3 family protein [Anaerolineales bacterium]|nr:cytochrome c3 family protein [Anaerolineales bacterium]
MQTFSPLQTCETCHAATPLSVDAKCQTCHSLLQRTVVLPSGDEVGLQVNAETIAYSMHGTRVIDGKTYETLACTECHQNQGHSGYPHAELDAESQRALTLEMQDVCTECHEEIAEKQHDSVHAAAIAEGKLEGATCIDCHGNHDIQDPDAPREQVSQTCGKCHSTINEQYAGSVHGAALLGEHNPDVPVCTDCHGVHDIGDPTTAAFRTSSPEMCGKCHADAEKMAKYDISTDVFDTYVADFHGTTVTLFEKQHPDQETNKAVCYDCHGIHNILPASDEHSQVIKENLLTTCQQCHPDATANFPNAWTSHFKPSLEHNTLVYLVDLFYAILIPVTVSGFLIFIGTDVTRRTVNRVRRRKQDRS